MRNGPQTAKHPQFPMGEEQKKEQAERLDAVFLRLRVFSFG